MRRHATIGATGIALAIGLGLAATAAPAFAAPAAVPDAALADCLNAELGHPSGTPLTTEEIATVVEISCSEVDDLTGLEHATALDDLYLSGGAFPSLAPLTGLTALEQFSANQNTAPITDLTPLAGLPNLSSLTVGNAPTTSLAFAATLPALVELELRNTQITDLAPLSGLTALTSVTLQAPGVTSLTALSSISTLKQLELVGPAGLSDLGPLASITGLEELILRGSAVSDLGPLAALDQLWSLRMLGSNVSSLSPLGAMASLTELMVTGAPLHDISPLGSLTTLERVSVDDTLVTDLGPLAANPHITWLSINNAPVSDLSVLAAFPDLTALMAAGAAITDPSYVPTPMGEVDLSSQRVDLGTVPVGAVLPNPLRDFDGALLSPSAESLAAAGATISADLAEITFPVRGAFELSWAIEKDFGDSEFPVSFDGVLAVTVGDPAAPAGTPPPTPVLAESGVELSGWLPAIALLLLGGAALTRLRRRA